MGGTGEKRTAVLVVHGMGSQRPLDTVRGVVDAVWLKGDQSATGSHRIWTHPERSGVDDIDLPVITTNFLSEESRRRIDFHELYWAHLMSETRAVAVLLWLFELARMGPRLKPSISAVYWGALIFLSALLLSVSLLVVQIIVQFAGLVAKVSEYNLFGSRTIPGDLHSLAYVLFGSIAVTALLAWLAAVSGRSIKLGAIFFAIGAIFVVLFWLVHLNEPVAELLTRALLPLVLAAIVVQFTMGGWGLKAFSIVVLSSWGVGILAVYFFELDLKFLLGSRIPWSITSFWSAIASCYLIGLYLALNAAFLQPYLGDAARYFRNSPANVAVRREIRRQAVGMLQALHLSGNYDRIIVVAHSLGTVVAYDMLRSYYSRINDALPDPKILEEVLRETPESGLIEKVDKGSLNKQDARNGGRKIIAAIAQLVGAAQTRIADNKARGDDDEKKAWLVTDFVTLGSPLTHALYLMCRGSNEQKLKDDFDRRVREREFPTCPPHMMDGDGRLMFRNPKTKELAFHHGGMFALTRWTNLYFPVSQLLWGDAIGGEVGSVFGDPSGSNIADLPVYTNSRNEDSFFAHILYWDLSNEASAPHIAALTSALDLEDTGAANKL